MYYIVRSNTYVSLVSSHFHKIFVKQFWRNIFRKYGIKRVSKFAKIQKSEYTAFCIALLFTLSFLKWPVLEMSSAEKKIIQTLDWFHQGGNSQNFLRKFVRFFVTLRCFLRILRPKNTKNLTNLRKKFCESPPSILQTAFVSADLSCFFAYKIELKVYTNCNKV
jgi:hypothetical protein